MIIFEWDWRVFLFHQFQICLDWIPNCTKNVNKVIQLAKVSFWIYFEVMDAQIILHRKLLPPLIGTGGIGINILFFLRTVYMFPIPLPPHWCGSNINICMFLMYQLIYLRNLVFDLHMNVFNIYIYMLYDTDIIYVWCSFAYVIHIEIQ